MSRSLLETISRRVDRRGILIALAGIVVFGAMLRFATLDLQSFRHDEAVTAGRVLRASLGDTLSTVPDSESTPPFYYLVAWLWSRPFGTGEVGLRSLSALLGTATIVVVAVAAIRLVSWRTGLVAAGLVAVSPVLVWFSQDARAYSLVVFLAAISFLFFVLATLEPDSPRAPRRLAWWALASALAIATHYFAAFLVLPEAALLLFRQRRRAAIVAVAAVALAAATLAPLALHQASSPRNDWVSGLELGERAERTAAKFVGADTGDEHGVRQAGPVPVAIPAALVAAGVLMSAFLTDRRQKRAAMLAFAVAASGLAIAAALAALGEDYVLGRNLLPMFVPAFVALAIGLGARRAGIWGSAAAVALCAAMLAFVVEMNREPRLQRENLRAAAETIGPASGPRAIVTVNHFADDPLAYYLGVTKIATGEAAGRRSRLKLAAIDFVGYGSLSARAAELGAGFKRVEVRPVTYNFTLTRFRAPQRRPVELSDLTDGKLVGTTGRAAVLIER